MPLIHFDTRKITLEPMVETIVKHFADPELQDLLRSIITEQGFYDGIGIDYPESEHMLVGVGRLEPGAGIPPVEKPLPTDEVLYVIEGSMIAASEGKRFTAYPGECIYISRGTSYAWSSETGCMVLYVAYPHPWKAIQEAYDAGILQRLAQQGAPDE